MSDVGNCTAFGRCGGCSSLNVPYEEQLAAKDSVIAKLFAGLAEPGAIRRIKGMQDPYHYRDKVIAPLVPGKRGPKGGREIRTGMYAKGTHDIVESDGCLLESEVAQKVVRAVVSIMRKHGVEPYNEDTERGFLRHVVVRVGHESGEVLVTLVTNGDEFPHSKSFCRELVKRVPQVTTVVQNINTRQTNVVLGDKERVLYGPGFILDTLCGMSFRISSQSFYQVNSQQTEVLYRTAIALAELEGGEAVIDAYCGTGTIGLVAAGENPGCQLVGVDSEASSIRDARQNAKHNGVENAEFLVADATDFMRETSRSASVLLMDPPRSGSTPEFLAAAAALAPERIVYISCNPQTQARDVRLLIDAGYAIDAVQPVDMFPHTDHIECVVRLVRNDAKGATGTVPMAPGRDA